MAGLGVVLTRSLNQGISMTNDPSTEQSALLSYMGKWLILSGAAAVLAGSASAFFLLALTSVTAMRDNAPYVVWLLPPGGFLMGWAIHRLRRNVDGGNKLIIDEIRIAKKAVPLRELPPALLGTVMSHLLGASVGREGVAIQMGSTLADQLSNAISADRKSRCILVIAGMSAGFSSVFGTPLAGAIFGLEVLSVRRMRYAAALPCFLAAILADQVRLIWGIPHVHYAVGTIPSFSVLSMAAVVAAGVIFGLSGMLFGRVTRKLSELAQHHVPYGPVRPLLGGALIAVAVYALGTQRYIGLGIPVIREAFQGQLGLQDAVAKMGFTAVSIASGFKGGEVTPLLFIGATLGNALAPLLHLPFSMLAALGYVAVFAGAASVPLASTVMAIELFGSPIAPYAAVACVLSWRFSGHADIYRSQRAGHAKLHHRLPENVRPSELPGHRLSKRENSKETPPEQ